MRLSWEQEEWRQRRVLELGRRRIAVGRWKGRWRHVAVVKDAGDSKPRFYVDGQPWDGFYNVAVTWPLGP